MDTIDKPDNIEDLLPAYALNALNNDDARSVQDALDREPRYQRLLAEHIETVARLASSHAAAVPSAAIRDRLMRQARAASTPPTSPAVSPPEQRPGAPRALWALVAVLAITVVSGGAFSVVQQQRLSDLEQTTAVEAATSSRQDLVELGETLARPGIAISQLRPPPLAALAAQPPSDPSQESNHPSDIPASAPADTPAGILAIDNQGAGVLVTLRLPPLDSSQTYQAWWRSNDSPPAPAATFNPDSGGYAQTQLQGSAHGMQSLAVTTEPAGGAESPSPNIVLTGPIPEPRP